MNLALAAAENYRAKGTVSGELVTNATLYAWKSKYGGLEVPP